MGLSRWVVNGNLEKVAGFIYCARVENIEKNYPLYLSIVDKFRYSNPGSQHTSSFHPLSLKTLEEQRELKKKFFGSKYVDRDHSTPGKQINFFNFIYFIFIYFIF